MNSTLLEVKVSPHLCLSVGLLVCHNFNSHAPIGALVAHKHTYITEVQKSWCGDAKHVTSKAEVMAEVEY